MPPLLKEMHTFCEQLQSSSDAHRALIDPDDRRIYDKFLSVYPAQLPPEYQVSKHRRPWLEDELSNVVFLGGGGSSGITVYNIQY